MKDIHFPEKVLFKNHFDERRLHLSRADCISSVPNARSRVTSICNQSTVYRNLFQERLKRARYTLSDADDFLAWANAGWKRSTHFVFFIIDDQFGIVGAIDIKSAELDNAEIGYWADSNHPGNITNAVLAMIDSAIETGFIRFTAFVRHDNDKSSRVLERAGFNLSNKVEKREGYFCWERRIT
jgi:RimJ/RimL family protein N-acetyltransferase